MDDRQSIPIVNKRRAPKGANKSAFDVGAARTWRAWWVLLE